ncbi:MAG TPA: methyltransferase, partial [Thermoprotei archaeon]|nr:methyltransferase [Thermoprotei archaeon]
MGLTYSFYEIRNRNLIIDDVDIDISMLKDIKWREGDLYCYENNIFVRLAWWRGESYYKLRSVGYNTAPTLEINGIHMHRIKDISPWKDSLQKVNAISIRPGEKILDICTGLGYTAIISLQKGAGKIITIEKDLNVLEMASYNPWSRKLDNDKIKIVIDDASKTIYSFSDNVFDKIIHDPPRFSLAGDLYSLNFYKQLY